MSFATAADGTRLQFDIKGVPGREPVLLIQGLGADKAGWFLQRVAFASAYRTVALDNRGAGRSDKPQAPYGLAHMAEDIRAVLDTAGLESAHIVGASLGGVVAQLFTVLHPDRVRSLVLASTACRHHEWRRELLAEWVEVAKADGMAEVARQALPWLVGPRSMRRFWPALGTLGPLALRIPPEAFAAQVRALLDFDDHRRSALSQLAVPTLVIVGNQDILTPRGDSEELAELIPGAELVVISGAAHGLFIEHATTFNRIVLDFLRRSGRQRRAA